MERLSQLQRRRFPIPENRDVLAFSKVDRDRLKEMWKSNKVKKGLRNVPLHAELQFI